MIAPFSHYFKTGPESPERKYRIMLARGGIAIANALQEMAANAKTIPAPSRAEIAPGKTYVKMVEWSLHVCRPPPTELKLHIPQYMDCIHQPTSPCLQTSSLRDSPRRRHPEASPEKTAQIATFVYRQIYSQSF